MVLLVVNVWLAWLKSWPSKHTCSLRCGACEALQEHLLSPQAGLSRAPAVATLTQREKKHHERYKFCPSSRGGHVPELRHAHRAPPHPLQPVSAPPA